MPRKRAYSFIIYVVDILIIASVIITDITVYFNLRTDILWILIPSLGDSGSNVGYACLWFIYVSLEEWERVRWLLGGLIFKSTDFSLDDGWIGGWDRSECMPGRGGPAVGQSRENNRIK